MNEPQPDAPAPANLTDEITLINLQIAELLREVKTGKAVPPPVWEKVDALISLKSELVQREMDRRHAAYLIEPAQLAEIMRGYTRVMIEEIQGIGDLLERDKVAPADVPGILLKRIGNRVAALVSGVDADWSPLPPEPLPPLTLRLESDGTIEGTCLRDVLTGRVLEGLCSGLVVIDVNENFPVTATVRLELAGIDVRAQVGAAFDAESGLQLEGEPVPGTLRVMGKSEDGSGIFGPINVDIYDANKAGIRSHTPRENVSRIDFAVPCGAIDGLFHKFYSHEPPTIEAFVYPGVSTD